MSTSFMKRVLRILVVSLLLAKAAAAQQAPDAAFEGTIVKSKTGEPLSKVKLELRGGSQTLVTTTETDGKFYFPNLQAGAYRILA